MVSFSLFLSFISLTFSSLLVVFAVLYIAFALCRKFFGLLRTQITQSTGNWRFYANCIFFLAISVFLPLIVSFFFSLDSNLPLRDFLRFQLVSSTLIVYFLTIDVLLPPIVIFSFFCCVD